jgi:hypothetical protein
MRKAKTMIPNGCGVLSSPHQILAAVFIFF